MKTIIVILLLTISAHATYPQETARERIEQRRLEEDARSSSNRVAKTSQTEVGLNDIIENSRWLRIIYRQIDLTDPQNAPLYYPETSSEGDMNLFAKIFTLLQNGKIKAYEYLDGIEVFTDEYLIDFREFMDRFGIYYEAGNQNSANIVIHGADIPSHEVQSYYLKEIYYFDTQTSGLRVLPVAICPIIHRQDNYQGTTRYPLFWVPYTEIALYMKQMPVMLSNLNNSTRGSVDDFFRTRRYNGEIYKTGNPGNLPIYQYTSSPEEMKAEQERIEQELIDFETSLRQQEAGISGQNGQSTLNQRDIRGVRSSRNTSGGTQTMRSRRY